MGLCYCAHSRGGWFIIEQHAVATVDLKVDEAGSEKRACWQAYLRQGGGNLSPRSNADNSIVVDQHSGFRVPAAAVEDTIR
jgi:hypothetical protein